MAERKITRREDFPWPHVVRKETATPIYADPEGKKDPTVKFDLSEGLQPFGPPHFVSTEVREAMFDREKFDNAIGKYGSVNLDEAKAFVQYFNGADPRYSHVSFENRGTYGAIVDVLVKGTFIAPNQGRIRIIDTNLDFPAAYKASRRFSKEISPYDQMPFIPLKSDPDATQDQVFDAAIEAVKKEGKKRRKNNVVVATDPNSPKGNSLKDRSKMETLAYECARLGYPLLIDQVVKANRYPWESYAYLTSEFPNIFLFDSPSKIWGMPGARIATVITSKEMGRSHEGPKTEYEFDGLQALLVSETYKFEHLFDIREWIDNVTQLNETFNRPFEDGLRKIGIKVYDSDPQIPFRWVMGRNENFCRNLKKLGIKVAPGGGFNSTYATEVSEALGTAVNRGVITGQWARVSTWKHYNDLPEILDLFDIANDMF